MFTGALLHLLFIDSWKYSVQITYPPPLAIWLWRECILIVCFYFEFFFFSTSFFFTLSVARLRTVVGEKRKGLFCERKKKEELLVIKNNYILQRKNFLRLNDSQLCAHTSTDMKRWSFHTTSQTILLIENSVPSSLPWLM